MRVSSIAALAVALMGSVYPVVADAGGAPAGDPPPAVDTADSLYNQGNEAYDRKDYALSYQLYSSAFKLRKSYDVARNLGLVELKLSKFKDAIGHLTYSIEHYPANRLDTKKQVIDWLAEAKASVGLLRLRVTPSTAVCRVNGAVVSREEREDDIPVDPGAQDIECGELDGHGTETRSVTIAKGERSEVVLKVPLAGPVASGAPTSEPVGGLAIAADTRRMMLYVGAATAAAGVAAGVVTGVLSIVKAGEANGMLADLRSSIGRQSPCAAPAAAACADLLALRRDQDTFGNTAFWTLLGGGVVGAGTAVLALVTRPTAAPAAAAPVTPSPARLSVAPVLGPATGGVVITGSF